MTEVRFAPSAFDNLGAPLDIENANDDEHEHGYLEIEEDEDNGSSLLESYKKRSSSLNSRLSARSHEGRYSFKLNASSAA